MAETTVGRDPFARGEYRRFSEAGQGETCGWCGQAPRTLYRYAWESDGQMRRSREPGGRGFCNLSCHRAYHG